MSPSAQAEPGGSAVVAKASALLRALGSVNAGGITTSALARATDQSRPTAHRLLTSLAGEGLVDRDAGTGRWHLGPELFVLGAAAATRYNIIEQARDIIAQLVDETEESAFLSTARGEETVCLLGVEGSFPLRSHVLHEGIRFPLGVASAGLAILAHLPPEDAERYVEHSDLIPRWGRPHSRRALRARIEATRRTGYSVNPGLVVAGSWGVGAVVFDRNSRPRWALSLTGVESRFTPRRIPRLGRLLLRSAHLLTQRIA